MHVQRKICTSLKLQVSSHSCMIIQWQLLINYHIPQLSKKKKHSQQIQLFIFKTGCKWIIICAPTFKCITEISMICNTASTVTRHAEVPQKRVSCRHHRTSSNSDVWWTQDFLLTWTNFPLRGWCWWLQTPQGIAKVDSSPQVVDLILHGWCFSL